MKRKKTSMPSIGQEELSVFQFVQSQDPVTVREVADHFASMGKARTTVLTVMERLRSKKLLTREKIGGSFRYHACIESTAILQSLVNDFVQNILGGSLSPFVAYLSEASNVSDQEVKELKRLVGQLDKKARDQ
ncbi:MAG: BlaI/MecI/CopY family transcriptional regulator [Pirellulaceae bacterium]|nr:BlaI/MecI/CopY family transcriptional regulator [Pirellulaceae bacterium]